MVGISSGPAVGDASPDPTEGLVADSAVAPEAAGRPVWRAAISAAAPSTPAPAPITEVPRPARRRPPGGLLISRTPEPRNAPDRNPGPRRRPPSTARATGWRTRRV